MPFEYTSLEDELAAKVQAHIAATGSLTGKVIAQAMPDSEEEFIEADETDRIIVYVFSATATGASKSSNEKAVNEEIVVNCNIQSRTRRGNNDYPGCNGLAKVLKELLTGYQPTHCGRLNWKSYQASNPPRDEEKKFWSYDVEFSTTKMFIQQEQEAPDFTGNPLLQEVILIDQVELP